MAYRETTKTKTKKAQVREKILLSAHQRVSQGGFREASVNDIAQHADVAVGTVYRHFPSKAELFSEVFRIATEKEVNNVSLAINSDATATERLIAAVDSFSRRSLKSPRLAWALIAEPVDPLVDAYRLTYRQAYAQLFEQLIEDGMHSGEWPPQNKTVGAAAIVGAMAETLVGPLSPPSKAESDDDAATLTLDSDKLITSITQFCVQALTGKEYKP